jgi:hypothetical protein
VDVLAQPAARHQHEPLAALGKLVGELHRDAAAERVADDARALDVQPDQQVADSGGESAQGVVAARLGRLAVAQQVGRDHGVVVGQLDHRLIPLGGAAGDAVDQHHGRAVAGDVEADAVAVEAHLGALDVRNGRYRAPAGLWLGSGLGRASLRSGGGGSHGGEGTDHPVSWTGFGRAGGGPRGPESR